MDKIWKINKKAPKAFLNRFPEYSDLALQLLWDRQVKSQVQIDKFFHPDYEEDLHDPFLMKGMKLAIKRLEKALKNKEKITIFGDYDADGVCSTAILSQTLSLFKMPIEVYIPNRNQDGYGLNMPAVKKAIEHGTTLIITVDCGMSDFKEIAYARRKKVDVMIIDHHEVAKKSPQASVLVNPRQKGEKYPFLDLAAAGVVFKVCQALLNKTKIKTPVGWEKWLLDLVAIATVSDCMPLVGENRTLVKYGLVVLAKTKRIGLQILARQNKLKLIKDNQLGLDSLDSYVLGFVFAPRINAAGRMGEALLAYKLLISNQPKEAEDLARELDNQNRRRIELTKKVVAESEKRVKANEQIIFEGSNDWPLGIVGLIAGRLADKYLKPTFIFQKGQTESTGSARSVAGFNIIEAIAKCALLLENFGGHAGAAGFTVNNNNLTKFERKLREIVTRRIKKDKIVPSLNIDKELKPEEINFQNLETIQEFAPFGEKNPSPLFLMKQVKMLSCRQVGQGQDHLKLALQKEGRQFKAIGFWLGHFCDKMKEKGNWDIVFELVANEWDGKKELEFKIKDIKESSL